MTIRAASRPRLGTGESSVGLLVRCAVRNGRRLTDLAWWTEEATVKQGVRALLVGESPAVGRLTGLLDKQEHEIARGTLRHLASFNEHRRSEFTRTRGHISRAQQEKGPTTLALDRLPRGAATPAFVHGWEVPYCPDCLTENPQSWPWQHHLALPGVCMTHQRILLLGCGACGGAGVTVVGQVRRAAHCADCRTDLRRMPSLPVQTVDGLDAAASCLTELLGHDTRRQDPDLLAGVLDLLTLGLISDPVPMRGAATAGIRRSLADARTAAVAARQPLRLAYRPDPAHVAAYLPAALALARDHLADPARVSPLVTVHGWQTMTPYDCFLGPVTRDRIRADRRRLHHVLGASVAGRQLVRPLHARQVPRLLPLSVYQRHLADLAEPVLEATGWPSQIELRQALASQLRGNLAWHADPAAFAYGRCHQYDDESVLHAVHEAMTTAGRDEHWTAGITHTAAALNALDIDWQLRSDLLRNASVLGRILRFVPSADPDEAHRWLHQVWASTTEPDLGLYGASVYLLDNASTSLNLETRLEQAAELAYGRAKRRELRRRA